MLYDERKSEIKIWGHHTTFYNRFHLSFYAMTVEVWKVTFTAIFLRNKVVHSVFCVFIMRCMYICADGQ